MRQITQRMPLQSARNEPPHAVREPRQNGASGVFAVESRENTGARAGHHGLPELPQPLQMLRHFRVFPEVGE